ncbi:piggyBac transposable element-derived protein 3-like isoform X1 [Trichoplusia ni]|uniref:PiggyBac transposable element-derived protein 3-like isoform X1 n=1 Tax=Trichoplusia ni TaxID=7111 RepID=A0A7E5WZ64_TRINI|nr:piggyBac transposable element-derived protein 3-like isoform X1 [Trichoplusia ni]
MHVVGYFVLEMAENNKRDGDIEFWLRQLEDGAISEDDFESDGDELDFYPTQQDLLDVLENDNDDGEARSSDNNEEIIPDPPIVIADAVPSNNIDAPVHSLDIQRLIWKNQPLPFNENAIKFNGTEEYPESLMNLQTPFQFFSYFFTEDFLSQIVTETNYYAVQKKPDRPDVITLGELRKYLGILIYMSVYHYPSVRGYWANKHGFEAIIKAMPVNKFEKIRRVLHFNDNNKHLPIGHPQHDRLHKLRPVIEHLNAKFSSIPISQRLSIDEQMCATKMGHFLKQYLPNKPHKWGFKLFVLCSLTGFAYRFIIYAGKEKDDRLPNEPDIGVVSQTVIKLARIIPRHANHIIYHDNFYTTLPLMYYFAKEGIQCVGTVQRNRLGKKCKLPSKQDVMKKQVPRGSYVEYITHIDGVDMSSVSWKDNKQVVLLSTYVGAEPLQSIERYDKIEKKKIIIDCPKIVKEYNAHMGGVDLMDSFLGRYRIKVKTRKWYMRIFYHLLDVSIINSWVLYKTVETRKGADPKKLKNLSEFRSELADVLCTYGTTTQPTRGRPSNSSITETIEAKRKKGCQVLPPSDVRLDNLGHSQIKTDQRMRCKRPGCKLQSFVKCTKCSVFLCAKKGNDCFNLFHS